MITVTKPNQTLNITLWVAQVILAGMFLLAGLMKTMMPMDKLSAMMPWTGETSEVLVRLNGVAEFLGVIGLLLPSIVRIKPMLTPIVAIGIALVMILAMAFHLSRGEASAIGLNVFNLFLAIFIAWGRFRKAPIS
jgi:uncharacterized membrane protein YphA (DoxX/SURF4 family)